MRDNFSLLCTSNDGCRSCYTPVGYWSLLSYRSFSSFVSTSCLAASRVASSQPWHLSFLSFHRAIILVHTTRIRLVCQHAIVVWRCVFASDVSSSVVPKGWQYARCHSVAQKPCSIHIQPMSSWARNAVSKGPLIDTGRPASAQLITLMIVSCRLLAVLVRVSCFLTDVSSSLRHWIRDLALHPRKWTWLSVSVLHLGHVVGYLLSHQWIVLPRGGGSGRI
jgi:hypothetical protein